MKHVIVTFQFLAILMLACWEVVNGQGKGFQNQKPNILLILVDDMGVNGISTYGHKPWQTPNIDKIATNGIKFSNAYVAPVCSPTRAALLTGRYPARVGITNWIPGGIARYKNPKLIEKTFQQFLPNGEVTIAEVLRKGGYQTAMVGKWHLGSNITQMPDKQGFDYQYMMNLGNPSTFFVDEDSIQTNGFYGEEGTGRKFLTDHFADKAIEWLDQPKTKPWFMYFSTHAVHIPIQAKEALVNKYLKNGVPKEGPDNALYAAMHEHMDEGIGRVLRFLEDKGLRKNTLIVFLSDNGGRVPQTNNTPFRGGKGGLIEGGIRAPMIFEWAGKIARGTISDRPVTEYDLFPTLLDVAGVERPANIKIDGISIKNTLFGGSVTKEMKERALFWHYPHYTGQPFGQPSSAIIKGDWKLIHYFEDDSRELFNLKTDLMENVNLVSKNPEIASKLFRELESWRKDVKAKIPEKNPKYDPSLPSGWPKSFVD
ncbi:MAG TPA: sulfatase [Sphingobacteriaceae bacterium]